MHDKPYIKRPEFVVVVNTKSEDERTVRITSVEELEAFLYRFGSTELAECVWKSLLYNYKTGVKNGMKKVGAPVNE